MRIMKTTWTLLALGGLLIAVDLSVRAGGTTAAPAEELDIAGASARIKGLFKTAAERRAAARQQFERVKKDLRYVSEELDRGLPVDEDSDKALDEFTNEALARLARLRKSGNLDPKLLPVLDQLEKLYRGLPSKTYAQEYAASLVRFVDEELRWAGQNGATTDEIVAILRRDLVLPDAIPGENDADDKGFFGQDMPVKQFLKQGPIKIFLAKHRLKRPKSHSRTTAEAIIEGKHNVQIGVEVEGVVTWASGKQVDKDYNFNFGELHMETTPEWRLLHKNFPKPKVGQHIRVRGWTYYDYFHASELEYDPADKVVGAKREIVWEVHPVQSVEILP